MVNNIIFLNSDVHNFGREAYLSGEYVYKARNLIPEALFLHESSLLRRKLNEIFFQIAPEQELLPALRFDEVPANGPTLQWQRMEHLQTTEIDRRLTPGECKQIGAMIALIYWSRLTDAHQDNIVAGLRNNRLIFVPIDWETCFTEMDHFMESGLFDCKAPGYQEPVLWNLSGLKKLLPYKNNIRETEVAHILSGHASMARLFQQHQSSLDEILQSELSGKQLIRRFIVRPTFHYFQLVEKESFIPEEKVQLERGDIPYFFQIDKDKEIYYWSDEKTFQAIQSEVPHAFFRSYKEPGYDMDALRRILLYLAREIDYHSSFGIVTRSDGVDIFYKETSIVIRIEDDMIAIKRKT